MFHESRDDRQVLVLACSQTSPLKRGSEGKIPHDESRYRLQVVVDNCNRYTRTVATRDVILQAAVKEIRERDEASFRVTAVAKAAGCATSVLYHYFGSREGLIDAALVAIVTEETNMLREFATLSFQAAQDTDDAVELMVNYALIAHDPSRRVDRALRARLVGAAQTRPSVRAEYAKYSDLAQHQNMQIIDTLKSKGLIREEVSSSAASLVMRALDYGWVLDEVHDAPTVPYDEWIGLIRLLATAFFRSSAYLPDANAD